MKRAVPIALALVLAGRVPAQQAKSASQGARTETSAQAASGQASAAMTPSQIFSRAKPSVVVIVASDQNDRHEALGSGFVVGHNRIATNHHVVEGMNKASVVFSDGDVKPVSRVVADSTQLDLIVLAVETGNRSPLVFGDELSLRQGDYVYALGAPKGLELSFTNGMVSSFRNSDGQFLIQNTAPIAPGSSGGPLFDQTGHVVGVTTSLLADASGIYFSVGIGDLKRLIRTPQGAALPFEEWAKHQSGRPLSGTRTDAAPGYSQDGHQADPSSPGRPIAATGAIPSDRDYYQQLYDSGGFFIPGFTRMDGARARSVDYVCFSNDDHSGRFFTFEAKYYDEEYIKAKHRLMQVLGAGDEYLGVRLQLWDIIKNKERALNAPYVSFKLDLAPTYQKMFPNGGGFMLAYLYEKGVKVSELVYEWNGNSWVSSIFPDTKPYTKASGIMHLSIEPTTMHYFQSITVPTTARNDGEEAAGTSRYGSQAGICEEIKDGPPLK